MARWLFSALVVGCWGGAGLGCAGAPEDEPAGHLHPLPAGDFETIHAAVTCDPKLEVYPIAGKHNGGWDKNALTYTCHPHPGSSPDNSDWIGGDHYGNDIFAKKGTPMVAPVSGTLVKVGTTTIGGNRVTIKDKCGWYYYHAHLDKLQPGLKEGNAIKAGAPIGTVGNTGNASGTSPHLHFSIYPGVYEQGKDPFPYLQKVDKEACTGGTPEPEPEPEPALPDMAIWSDTSAADTMSGGGASKDIGDVVEGEVFTVNIYVQNKASGGATKDAVKVGYWLETPWLVPVSYEISTDWPKKDQKTWKINDANTAPENPPHTEPPPATAKLNLYAMSPGETKRISIKVRAVDYSLGAVDHPDVRAWVWHVGGYYGEMTGFYDEVETNKAGSLLRTYQQHDVYGFDHFQFSGQAGEKEGWAKVSGVSALGVSEGSLVMTQTGVSPGIRSREVAWDASVYGGVELQARHEGGPAASQLFFITDTDAEWNDAKSIWFESPGEGGWHLLTVSAAHNPLWTGQITRIRLDPTPAGVGDYAIDYLAAVSDPGVTSGDANDDGVLDLFEAPTPLPDDPEPVDPTEPPDDPTEPPDDPDDPGATDEPGDTDTGGTTGTEGPHAGPDPLPIGGSETVTVNQASSLVGEEAGCSSGTTGSPTPIALVGLVLLLALVARRRS